jgi:hypothetical protein
MNLGFHDFDVQIQRISVLTRQKKGFEDLMDLNTRPTLSLGVLIRCMWRIHIHFESLMRVQHKRSQPWEYAKQLTLSRIDQVACCGPLQECRLTPAAQTNTAGVARSEIHNQGSSPSPSYANAFTVHKPFSSLIGLYFCFSILLLDVSLIAFMIAEQ